MVWHPTSARAGSLLCGWARFRVNGVGLSSELSMQVYGHSPRQCCPCLLQRSLSPSASQMVPIWGLHSGWGCIEFLPWNQQNLLQHFAWIKIFVPFFTGQREDSRSLRRKEIITEPYRSRSCATAAHSLRGRNMGPQTWNTTLSKCLWAAQEKHPPEAYLITRISNRLNVCTGFLHFAPTSPS